MEIVKTTAAVGARPFQQVQVAVDAKPATITITLTHEEVRVVVATMGPRTMQFYLRSGVSTSLSHHIYNALAKFLGRDVTGEIAQTQKRSGIDR